MAAAADGITHRDVEVNGVRLHVAEAGPAGAPVALLLHGFPQLWYSWRHQMPALAAAGYRAVAPDLRGYGGSDAPPGGPDKYTVLHVVGDLVALVDCLGQEQVFVVAHDWGALIAWHMCMFRPDKVRALVAMSVAFFPRDPAQTLVEAFRSLYGDEFYVCRFQEPGAMEAEFARLGTELVLRKFLTITGEPLIIPRSGWGSPDDDVPLPSWITEEDIGYYTSQFQRTGFTGGLNYYRALDKSWELTAPWNGAEVKVPAKFIIGDQDLTFVFPATQEFIRDGGSSRKFVPLLDEVVIMEGVGHFINEEKPDEINEIIINFLEKFS